MKTTLFPIITGILILTAIAEALTTPDPQKELARIEQEWNDAYTRHDRATLQRILSDDWVFVDADGNVLNKQKYIETGARVQVKSEKLTDIVVRVYGDTAVVTTRWNGTYTFDGREVTETIRYMDTFIKQNGSWKAVATQGTRLVSR